MEKRVRARDMNIKIGVMKTGKYNAITDVEGVGVGHSTIIEGEGALVIGKGPIRTGVTAIVPHQGNIYEDKVRAAVYAYNAYGKAVGLPQVNHMGVIETPILLTDTLNVWIVADALIDYMYEVMNVKVMSINPVVGETNGSYLNDSIGRHVRKRHVFEALRKAYSQDGVGPVEEGNVGGGTPMSGFELKGGIGTSSRVTNEFSLGVLVQLNFGKREDLRIDGVPVGMELSDVEPRGKQRSNSIMIIVATDLKLTSQQLWKIAKRAMLGVARTGSYGSSTSGDFVIAFSTSKRDLDSLIESIQKDTGRRKETIEADESFLNPVFKATVEATEEAIVNALFKAETMIGRDFHIRKAIPLDRVREIMAKYGRI
ncbi:S58 family peptidase [Candidatus Bathyarchaeota archaeon]|nr:MAG: S58 family peptidase [Candidatus Bathyarchaeota archaeon]